MPSLLDSNVLQGILRQLESTDVQELEIEVGDSRLYIRREPGQVFHVVDRAGGSRQPPAVQGIPVLAPLAGVYYGRPSPDQEPFVSVGGKVLQGDVVALIETMKLFNEVMADTTGTVLSVEVREGDLVESGQPLLYLAPAIEEEHA